MAEIRKSWTYTNALGVPVTEPISIQGQEFANGAPASGKVDPNARVGSQIRTDGWQSQIPDGAEFNWSWARLSTMLSEIEGRGFPAWSSLTTYTVPAYVWGSDSNTYTALQASGPGAGAKDPISEPLYWGIVSIPVGAAGEVISVAGDTPLTGTLVCNGASFSNITYSTLFNAIGYKYGGLGEFFNIPDYQGYFLRGHDPNGTVDVGNEVSFTGNTTNGSAYITNVNSFTNLDIGMTITNTTGGTLPNGTKIVDFIYQVLSAGSTLVPVLTSILVDFPAAGSASETVTVTNRLDRGDGILGRAVGTKQFHNIGEHLHAVMTYLKLVGEAVDPTTLNLNVPLDQVHPGTVTPFVAHPLGTYPYQAADTRPENISVLYCIKY